MAFTNLNELDVVFISFDEDNCEENWANLLEIVPWAQRVHGVKGSDAAHKAAANLVTTERFISVDADNLVDPAFFDIEMDFEHIKLKNKAVSWAAKNVVNGLEYGNGGLKCWPKQYVLNMKTHENAESDDERNQVDFCWEDSYIQMSEQYSTTYPNSSPRQAFRAGFREGVKMSLSQGGKIAPDDFKKVLWWGNYKRLITWCSVGADTDNGLWAIYGARLGCQMTNLTDWDYLNVRDFDWLNNFFEKEIMPRFAVDEFRTTTVHKCYKTGYMWESYSLTQAIEKLGDVLRKGLGIELAELDEDQSKFYKAAQYNAPRLGRMITEDELHSMRRTHK